MVGVGRLKKKYLLIGVGVLLLILVLLFFKFGGKRLVVEDNLGEIEEAPLVLLMGSVGDRALGAYELYEEGKVNHIYMMESHLAGRDILKEQSISLPGDADLSRSILMDLGVPEEMITILPGDAESTKDEALLFREFLQAHPEIDEIILTTSKFHSYRSKRIFGKALREHEVVIYSAPTSYDRFDEQAWYQNREDIQRVITEYMKIAHYLLLEQFQM